MITNIPKIIHQIWIQGYDKIPEHLKLYHKSCLDINSDFEHIFWDDVKIINFLSTVYNENYVNTYKNYKKLAQKADFARYAILYKYGGIYLDMDMLCRKNLSSFLSYNLFCTVDILSIISTRYLNGTIGTKPNHPLFMYVFKNIFKRLPKSSNVTYSTGTILFYDSVKEYKKTTGKSDISIIDRKYLHPCQPYDDDDCGSKCKDCYVSHMNNGSWKSGIHKYAEKNCMKILKWLVLIILIIVFYIFIINKQY